MLVTGKRDRTEKKEVAVTRAILFYGAAVPAECCLPQPASQKFPCPFPLTMAPPLTPGRGLRDGDCSVANLLSLFTEVLSLCQPRISPKGVGIAPMRVSSCLSAPPLAKAQMGLRGGVPLSGIQPV